MMKRWVIIVVLVSLLITLLALGPISPVRAQTETATLAPTLAPYYSTADLSGGTLLIERRVTFGDLFVGFAALLVAVVIGASVLPDLGERIFRR